MESLVSELISNKIQRVLSGGIKKYISLTRALRQIGNTLILFQFLMIGIQFGILMLISPLLLSQTAEKPYPWIPYVGAALVFVFSGLLIKSNTEAEWTKRMKIHEAIEAVDSIAPNGNARQKMSST